MIKEASESEGIPGDKLLNYHVLPLYDFKKEATIAYDFLKDEGFLDKGLFMVIIPGPKPKRYLRADRDSYYVLVPTGIDGKTLLDFYTKWTEMANNNKFNFLINYAKGRFTTGRELVKIPDPVFEWVPMKKKTREHFSDILDSLDESSSAEFNNNLEKLLKGSELWVLYLKFVIPIRGVDSTGEYKLITIENLKGKDLYFFEKSRELGTEKTGIYDDVINSIFPRWGKSITPSHIKKYGKHRHIYFTSFNKDSLESIIKSYKNNYGEKFYPAPVLKPETEKHFGDILSELEDK